MQGGVSRFHFMYTICGEMCANHILEVLGPRLFDCCTTQINHTQLFSVIMWPLWLLPPFCCHKKGHDFSRLPSHGYLWRHNVICYMGMLTRPVWKYLVLTRWHTQRNVFLFNSADMIVGCHADGGTRLMVGMAQHSFSFFTTVPTIREAYRQRVLYILRIKRFNNRFSLQMDGD